MNDVDQTPVVEEDANGGPPPVAMVVSEAIASMFHTHVSSLKRRREERKTQLTLRGIAAKSTDGDADAGGGAVSSKEVVDTVLSNEDDLFEGDGVLRTLQALLSRIDERGYARSTQQIRFHDAFIRACSRVLYRNDWATNRPQIMKHNGWNSSPSEILISTPRRFGKTFSFVSNVLEPNPLNTFRLVVSAQYCHLCGCYCYGSTIGDRNFFSRPSRLAQAAGKNN